jgi:hypothetical protein
MDSIYKRSSSTSILGIKKNLTPNQKNAKTKRTYVDGNLLENVYCLNLAKP